eukprot:CAMPEP_0175100952 /NCGR_PEP_ID=MMETSP0086_2-20121207/7467_1 /TAXON_ID=136419 /ORGANISM="Unknown Unknown, Strain D1" /LENGTH=265 /DNA_ID=CAMNT_0016375309 /DNA_START=159 /DNA_END=956 /DNA_ORIENTATION=+
MIKVLLSLVMFGVAQGQCCVDACGGSVFRCGYQCTGGSIETCQCARNCLPSPYTISRCTPNSCNVCLTKDLDECIAKYNQCLAVAGNNLEEACLCHSSTLAKCLHSKWCENAARAPEKPECYQACKPWKSAPCVDAYTKCTNSAGGDMEKVCGCYKVAASCLAIAGSSCSGLIQSPCATGKPTPSATTGKPTPSASSNPSSSNAQCIEAATTCISCKALCSTQVCYANCETEYTRKCTVGTCTNSASSLHVGFTTFALVAAAFLR